MSALKEREQIGVRIKGDLLNHLAILQECWTGDVGKPNEAEVIREACRRCAEIESAKKSRKKA
jgi:hypothetical protein